MFEKIVAKDNIYKAYRKALKSKGKYNFKAIEFAQDETYNLIQLRQNLIDETYCFDGYIKFPVYEPKKRIVHAPYFKDKIVQLAINDVLKEVYYPTFIYDSYACMDNKGTHKCAARIQDFIRRARWEYGESACIVKIDVKKFFYSIDREVMKSLLLKRIKCEKTLRLICKIIDSADVIDPLGMPLGNTLSQISANIYMNKVDQYCKRKLGIKYMVRYMDDLVLILPNKSEARHVLGLVREFIEGTLNLKLNEDKTKIFPIQQGVNVVGFRIYATHKLLRNDSKKKIKRKVKAMPKLIREGRITEQKAEQMMNSWLGHAKHANSHGFILHLLDKNDFIYQGKRECLRIRR